MADNVAYTAGAGTTIATDDVGGVHYQRTKLVDGTLDSSVAVKANANGALYVDTREELAHVQLTFTPTLTNFGTLYTTGDCLGTLTTVAGAARTSAAGGYIRAVRVLDKTQAQRAAFDIYIFSATVTTAADNAAFQLSDADRALVQAYIPIIAADYATADPGTPNGSIAYKPNMGVAANPGTMMIPYVCAATSLFVQLVVRGGPTYTSTSDLVVILDTIQD